MNIRNACAKSVVATFTCAHNATVRLLSSQKTYEVHGRLMMCTFEAAATISFKKARFAIVIIGVHTHIHKWKIPAFVSERWRNKGNWTRL